MTGTQVHHDGIIYELVDPATMRLWVMVPIDQTLSHAVELSTICFWTEEQGLWKLQSDGATEDSWEHGSVLIFRGTKYRLPTEQKAEKIIELLRLLEGVEY